MKPVRILHAVSNRNLLRWGCPVADCSLDAVARPNRPGGCTDTWADLLPDPSPTAEQEMLAEERRLALARAVLALPARERRILIRRYCSEDDEVPLAVIGREMHYCRERIRQLKVEACGRLREALR